jgi:hypothetical protein
MLLNCGARAGDAAFDHSPLGAPRATRPVRRRLPIEIKTARARRVPTARPSGAAACSERRHRGLPFRSQSMIAASAAASARP